MNYPEIIVMEYEVQADVMDSDADEEEQGDEQVDGAHQEEIDFDVGTMYKEV